MQFVPVIGQAAGAVLGTVALGAAAVSLVSNLALASIGQANGWAIATDVLGIVSFGVGAAASRAALAGARGAVPAARAAVASTLRAAGIGRATAKASRVIGGLDASGARAVAGAVRMSRGASRVLGTVTTPSAFSWLVGRGARSVARPGAAEELRTLANARTLAQARAAGSAQLGRLRGIDELADARAVRALLPGAVRRLPEVDRRSSSTAPRATPPWPPSPCRRRSTSAASSAAGWPRHERPEYR